MPGPPIPQPSSGLNEVLRRLGINLPMPQTPQERSAMKLGGVAQGIGDIGKFLGGLVTGPNMSGPVDATDLGGVLSMLAPALLGKIVYHGTPHTFEKFDLSRVGTGEGAQAYGHGLYFADDPRVAMAYRPEPGRGASPADMAERVLGAVERDEERAIEELQRRLANWESLEGRFKTPGFDETVKFAIDAIRSGNTRHGMLAKVDLPDEAIAKMIDWDAPISQQPPNVQAIARELGFTGRNARGDIYDPPGQVLYDAVGTRRWLASNPTSSANPGRAQEAASAWLRERGVPGIRYFDRFSRNAGSGSRNYVAFDDQLPKIVGFEQ